MEQKERKTTKNTSNKEKEKAYHKVSDTRQNHPFYTIYQTDKNRIQISSKQEIKKKKKKIHRTIKEGVTLERNKPKQE